jgi:hypothetical protein
MANIRGHYWRNTAENLPPTTTQLDSPREGEVERFHIVARPYEIKTQNEGVV